MQSMALKSVALAPLNVAGACIGCLCQGSREDRHFSEDASTELLEHLASTLALCIQNSVNKARLQRHGLTDPLTGVANRRLLMRRLREEVDRCRRYEHPVSCIMVDLDHFKQINDRYGHTAGDRMLVQVAEALKRGLRSSDLLARYGGEEFVLLLPETTQELALEIAKRHHREITHLQLQYDRRENIEITASFGVAELTGAGHGDSEGAEVLIKQADAAMYAAKRAGRNRIVAADRD
jgi:diguanylate cyclase (GGDEF)-like protein